MKNAQRIFKICQIVMREHKKSEILQLRYEVESFRIQLQAIVRVEHNIQQYVLTKTTQQLKSIRIKLTSVSALKDRRAFFLFR